MTAGIFRGQVSRLISGQLSEFVNLRKLNSYIWKLGSVLPHPECHHRVPENGIRLQAWIRDREALAKVRSWIHSMRWRHVSTSVHLLLYPRDIVPVLEHRESPRNERGSFVLSDIHRGVSSNRAGETGSQRGGAEYAVRLKANTRLDPTGNDALNAPCP